MRFGITLPHYDYSLNDKKPITFEDIKESFSIADELGFDIAYISDHPRLDIAKYGGDDTPYRSFEPLTLAAALGSLNKQIELGSLVLCESLRHPVNTASSAQSISDIAGQYTLGLGAGWYEPDYSIYGDEMPPIGERMTRLSESLQIIGQLLNGENVNFEGKHYSTNNAMLQTPGTELQSKVKLIVGGKGDRLLSIIARYADGWNTCWAWNFDSYSQRLDSLKKSCDKYGRDPDTVFKSLGLYSLIAQSETDLQDMFDQMTSLSPQGVAPKSLDEWRQDHLVGTVEEIAEQLTNWKKLGVDEMVLNPGYAPFHVGSNDILEEIGKSLSNAKEMADI